MSIDVSAVRADTPACHDQAFLDNAGSALSPKVVTQTVIDHLDREQEIGGYAAMEEAEDRLFAVVASAGRLVGVSPDQIALQPSATYAWLRAFTSIPLDAGDRILTTRAEYASNALAMIQAARRAQATVEFVPNGPDGSVDPTALADLLDERVKVVAITHAASQNGLVADATRIGSVLRDSGSRAWYVLDACQSVGQLPVDLASVGADFIAATGRKFLRAPRGTGFLAVSERVLAELEPVPIDMFGAVWDGEFGYELSPTATRYQSFETSYAGVLGLGAAIDYALDIGVEATHARIAGLADSLRSKLANVDGVRVLDRGTEKSGIVVFSCPGGDDWATVRALRSKGVIVTAVTRLTNPSHVDTYESNCVLRASPHIYNTESDLDRLISALSSLTW